MSAAQRVAIRCEGRELDIEYRLCGAVDDDNAPWIVFLHEGLGCSALWRDFPDRLCAETGARGLVYSRPGYGQSTPRPAQEHWQPDFMHRQAELVLPALLDALDIVTPVWLLGHSDGGSIALIFAALFRQRCCGLVLVAPHILVEEVSVANIEKARKQYEHGELRQRLARYHADPDSAFYGWNDIWLSPAFRDWNLYQESSALGCPVMAVQGCEDEYGTLEQIRGIRKRAPQTELLEIPDCGHWPHRDASETLLDAATRFIKTTGAVTAAPSSTGVSA